MRYVCAIVMIWPSALSTPIHSTPVSHIVFSIAQTNQHIAFSPRLVMLCIEPFICK